MIAAAAYGIAGCATVDTKKQQSVGPDRSAAGSVMEPGDPAAPADRAVVAAADGQASDPGAASAAAKQSHDQSATAKASSSQKSSTDGVSDARQRRLLEVAADFDRRRDEAQFQAAQNRWHEDDAAGCRETLDQLLSRCPSHCPARLLLANLDLADGNPKAALEHARQVLALEPQNAEAHHLMGLALDALGETAAAISHYEQATRLDSQNEQYAACYHAALDALGPPPMPTAEKVPTGSAPPNPSDSMNSSIRADGAGGDDRSGNAAVAGRVVQASATTPIAADCDESPEANRAVARAVDALRSGRSQDAVDIAGPALVEHPKSAALCRALGAAQYRLGNYVAAQVTITKALSLDKSDALAYFLMGSTLVRLGQPEAAERQFAEAARLDPRFSRRD